MDSESSLLYDSMLLYSRAHSCSQSGITRCDINQFDQISITNSNRFSSYLQDNLIIIWIRELISEQIRSDRIPQAAALECSSRRAGIGRAVTLALTRLGCRVIAVASTAALLESLVAEVHVSSLT